MYLQGFLCLLVRTAAVDKAASRLWDIIFFPGPPINQPATCSPQQRQLLFLGMHQLHVQCGVDQTSRRSYSSKCRLTSRTTLSMQEHHPVRLNVCKHNFCSITALRLEFIHLVTKCRSTASLSVHPHLYNCHGWHCSRETTYYKSTRCAANLSRWTDTVDLTDILNKQWHARCPAHQPPWPPAPARS